MTDLTVNSMYICTMVKELSHHCGIASSGCPVQCCLTLHTNSLQLKKAQQSLMLVLCS